ncbi:MAG: hypothetical protein JWM49_1089 [Microbacteriaceae bacterium]|nr:hypothetical protein [Microbacteriaceae bacterium]
MVRVLDTLDALIRFMIRPAFVSVWTNPQIEYTLLMPRLLLDLGREDRMLAAWVQRQIQLMQLATSKKEAVRIRASVAEKLLGWHLGEINTAWFADQVRNDPAAVKLEIPLRAKAKQLSNDAWAWAQLFAALAAVGLMFRQVFKPSNDA